MIKRELPIDLLEFFYLTPLPGSEDHLKLHRAGVEMDPDLNKYDLNHCTTGHPRMSKADWERAYRLAWESYYTLDHVETILRRAAATSATRIRVSASNVMFLITWFKGCLGIEGIHPLEGGAVRLKFRRDRRPGLPTEPVWRLLSGLCRRDGREARALGHALRAARPDLSRIERDPARHRYTDAALTPVADDDTETRDLFRGRGAQTYLEEQRRLDGIRLAAAGGDRRHQRAPASS